MPGKPKLSEAQRGPLFELVKWQEKAGAEIVYGLKGQDSVAIHSVRFDKDSRRLESPIVTVPCEYIRCWQERGFVTLGMRWSERSSTGFPPRDKFPTLILNAEAMEYEERMSKPFLVRIVLDLLDDWGKDLRAGVVAFVVALLTALAVNCCGAT